MARPYRFSMVGGGTRDAAVWAAMCWERQIGQGKATGREKRSGIGEKEESAVTCLVDELWDHLTRGREREVSPDTLSRCDPLAEIDLGRVNNIFTDDYLKNWGCVRGARYQR